ncbi:DUF192 domain-containing protein [Paracoccus sp. Z118]|uniref:DUF192 domain-containing protein n=1 Tax=Paracoccus sp. Z118 TaxID=2851017 RepID=UPI00353015C9
MPSHAAWRGWNAAAAAILPRVVFRVEGSGIFAALYRSARRGRDCVRDPTLHTVPPVQRSGEHRKSAATLHRWAAGAILATLILPAAPAAAAGICRDSIAVIVGTDGREVPFSVEIADTPAARAQGLMHRRSLPPGTGMLFVYEQPQPVSFWMKDTLIPLDLLFIDAAGTVRHIHAQARPLDLTPLPGAVPGDPDPDRLMVLEIGGSEAERLGLEPGATLRHPRVPQDKAATPCG